MPGLVMVKWDFYIENNSHCANVVFMYSAVHLIQALTGDYGPC